MLRALGVREELHHNSLRFSLGRFSTDKEVDMTLKLLKYHIPRLRDMSPLYDMYLDGVDIANIEWEQPK